MKKCLVVLCIMMYLLCMVYIYQVAIGDPGVDRQSRSWLSQHFAKRSHRKQKRSNDPLPNTTFTKINILSDKLHDIILPDLKSSVPEAPPLLPRSSEDPTHEIEITDDNKLVFRGEEIGEGEIPDELIIGAGLASSIWDDD